jgi:hypothetical protein
MTSTSTASALDELSTDPGIGSNMHSCRRFAIAHAGAGARAHSRARHDHDHDHTY